MAAERHISAMDRSTSQAEFLPSVADHRALNGFAVASQAAPIR